MTNDQNSGDNPKHTADNSQNLNTDFTNTTNQTLNLSQDMNQPSKEAKNIALIAHITLIGWIVALVMNNTAKTEFGSFYIRQMLGLLLCMILLNFIPFIGWIASLGVVVFWIISLIGAIGGEKKLTPIVGTYFQDWFKTL